jgi:hypothetical protein
LIVRGRNAGMEQVAPEFESHLDGA